MNVNDDITLARIRANEAQQRLARKIMRTICRNEGCNKKRALGSSRCSDCSEKHRAEQAVK